MNNPESYVLTNNRFNTYMVLIFTDLKKAQIYKIPYKNSQHKENEIVTKFDYLHLFRPFGIEKMFHSRIETNENFLFKIGDKNISMLEIKYLLLKRLMILKNTFQNVKIMILNTLLLSVMKIYISCYMINILISKNLKTAKWLTNMITCTIKIKN